MATATDDTTELTPEEQRARLADLYTKGLPAKPVSAAAPMTPLGAAPDPTQPAAPTGLPTVGTPTIAKPTTAESHAAGKAEYQAGLPQVTAPALSSEHAQQEAQLAEYKRLHPLGGDISERPGFLGKLEHGLAKVGNVAGNIVAPGTMANIPGTDLYNREQENRFAKQYTGALENESREEANKGAAAGNELIPYKNPITGEETQIQRKQWAPLEIAGVKSGTQEDITDKKVGATDRGTQEKQNAMLREHGLKMDPANPNGPPIAIPDSEMSPKELQQRDLLKATSELHQAQAEVEAAKNDPTSPQYKLAMEHLQVAKSNAAEKWASLNVEEQKVAAESDRTNKGAVTAFNKAYKQPADAVEKSYQMMDTAYREYKDAEAKGESLPTGAQSMVALSTHLSTTFGNVKGARITKDMIEHHLGARGVGDEALVAVQRLTNGDVLSPAQWDAFHDLIKQSRNLSWHAAKREADRAGIPLDFLPDDLQATEGEGVAYTPTQANPHGPAKKPTAAAGGDEFGKFGGTPH